MSLIRIDMPKGVEEGKTTLSPSSPTRSNMGSPPVSRRGAIMLGYGAMVAAQSLQVATQEIRASGNEELATDIENATKTAGIITAVIATKGLALVPLAISGATQTVQRTLNTKRTNRERRYERSMQGSRVTYNSGGGYE